MQGSTGSKIIFTLCAQHFIFQIEVHGKQIVKDDFVDEAGFVQENRNRRATPLSYTDASSKQVPVGKFVCFICRCNVISCRNYI